MAKRKDSTMADLAKATEGMTPTETARFASMRSTIGACHWDENNPRARYSALTNPASQQPPVSHIYLDPRYTFLGVERLRSQAEAITLHQNDPIIGALLGDLANMIVGADGGRCIIRSESNPEWAKLATSYLNGKWSDDCDFRRFGNTFHTLLHTTCMIAPRDGDVLWCIDEEITDGRILMYEADQIVDIANIEEFDLKGAKAPFTQRDGVVFDGFGRCIGVHVTQQRAKKVVENKEAVFLPIDSCRIHLGETYRANQHRGDSVILCLLTILVHNSKMLESTVISAQRAAEDIAVHKCAEPVNNLLDSAAAARVGVTFTKPVMTPIGGGVVTIGPDDEYTINTNTKPEQNMLDFGDWFRRVAYKRFGLQGSTATGKFDTTDQGKADAVINAIAIAAYQKVLEDKIVRWALKKGIEHGYTIGEIGKPPADYSITVLWPRPPTQQFDQTAADSINRIRSGASSFTKEFGPDWGATFEELVRETEEMRAAGMEHLDVFSTVAGKSVELDKESPAGTAPGIEPATVPPPSKAKASWLSGWLFRMGINRAGDRK